MVKICYLTYYTFPEVHGGAPIYTYKIARYFTEKGFETVIIGRKRNASSDEIRFHNLLIRRFSNLRFKWTTYNRIIDKNFSFPISVSRKVVNECENAHILHIVSSSLFFPIGYLVKKKLNIPIVVSLIEDIWTKTSNIFLLDIYLRYQRWQLYMALNYADFIIVHSDHALQKIEKQYPQYSPKIRRIYEGIDPLIIETLKKSNSLDKYKDDQKVILVAGSLVKGKNVEVVLNAVRILRKRGIEVKVLIIGNGPLKGNLKDLAKKMKIENFVNFVGEIKHEEIGNFYNLADIIVQPSRGEGSQPPPSVIEYLASGKPVIISEACDMSGLLKDCTLRFNPDDAKELSEKIEKLLFEKSLQKRLEKKGIKKIKDFSVQKFLSGFKEVYEFVLSLV